MKNYSSFEAVAFPKRDVDTPVSGDWKQSVGKNPYSGRKGRDIKYKKNEFNQTRSDGCQCGGPNDPDMYGGKDWHVSQAGFG